MNLQRLIMTALKHTPAPLIQLMAGKPLVIDGNRLEPHLQLLAKMAPTPDADNPPSLEDMRADIRNTFVALNGARRKAVTSRDTKIDGPKLASKGGKGSKAGKVKMPIRIYEPLNCSDNAPAILFFHQGGLVVMDLDSDDAFCTIMADICGARVISLDYRLCPEHAFPAPLDDVVALWEHVQKNAKKLKIDANRVAVAGDSAGGFLASNLCQFLRDKGAAMPVAQLLVYPWVSSRMDAGGSIDSCAETFPLNRATMEFFTAMVFPDGKGMDTPLANPLENPLHDLPPAIVATAGFDPIRDQGDAYAQALLAAGVSVTHFRYTNLCHSFLSLGNVAAAAERASIELADALKTRL